MLVCISPAKTLDESKEDNFESWSQPEFLEYSDKLISKLRRLSTQYEAQLIPFSAVRQSIHSWIGHAQHANTYNLRQKLLSEITFKRDSTRGASRRLVEQQPGQRSLRLPQQKSSEQP